LVAVAYTTLCRRSELVALVRDDLEIGADGVGTVIIRRGKGDQEGQGAVAPITPDPMRHLRAWIDAASLEAGPLFRAVLKGGRVGGPLDAGDVARIYKAMARRAGLSEADVAQISGHSTRVGASQDMLPTANRLPAIMQAGGWKTGRPLHRQARRPLQRRRTHRRSPRAVLEARCRPPARYVFLR
jgi:integrase